MGLKNKNEGLLGSAKKRDAQDSVAKASNPKNQQGMTADKRKTGIVRAADRK